MSEESTRMPLPLIPDDAVLNVDPAFVEFAVQALAESELADGLSDAQKVQLVTAGQRRQYAPGQVVFNEHERSREIYIVEAGPVEIMLDPHSVGDDVAALRKIATLSVGQICGEMALLDGGVRSARAVAGQQGARLLGFTSNKLTALCEADTAIGYRLMRNLAGALALRLRLQDMRLYSAE